MAVKGLNQPAFWQKPQPIASVSGGWGVGGGRDGRRLGGWGGGSVAMSVKFRYHSYVLRSFSIFFIIAFFRVDWWNAQ